MISQIKKIGIIPVIVLNNQQEVELLGNALSLGGIPCAEITFRSEFAAEAIALMVTKFPDILVGAGTVLTCEQVDKAIKAGAKFIVTPGLNERVVRYCQEKNILVIPGVCTPSEIERALGLGIEIVKFFPAEVFGGINFIKAVSAPYSNVKFIPTGGINLNNVENYLKHPRVLACGGSWMVKRDLIENQEYDHITNLIKDAKRIVNSVRGNP